MPPAELLGWLQLAAILIGIVAVFINIGRKDATLAAMRGPSRSFGRSRPTS